jgi:hypothetical protein
MVVARMLWIGLTGIVGTTVESRSGSGFGAERAPRIVDTAVGDRHAAAAALPVARIIQCTKHFIVARFTLGDKSTHAAALCRIANGTNALALGRAANLSPGKRRATELLAIPVLGVILRTCISIITKGRAQLVAGTDEVSVFEMRRERILADRDRMKVVRIARWNVADLKLYCRRR